MYAITWQKYAAMSVTKTKARWFRIYSADRHVRKAVGANTLDDLITEGISFYADCIDWLDSV